MTLLKMMPYTPPKYDSRCVLWLLDKSLMSATYPPPSREGKNTKTSLRAFRGLAGVKVARSPRRVTLLSKTGSGECSCLLAGVVSSKARQSFCFVLMACVMRYSWPSALSQRALHSFCLLDVFLGVRVVLGGRRVKNRV